MLRRWKALWTVDAGNIELIQAQYSAFTKQVPLLYFILMTNCIGLSITHYGSAPDWLTVVIPGFLCALCSFRLYGWWKMKGLAVSHEAAVRRLQATLYLTPPFGIGFSAWSLSLFPYGSIEAQGHVAFFMAITVIGCIFCLMHVRVAAMALAVTVFIPFTLFFGSTGKTVFISIAINMVLVMSALTYLLWKHYGLFVELIGSQKELVARHRETQRLSDENNLIANSDSLTGLPNRRCFQAEFSRRLEKADARKERLAVGIIDLDGFKGVNDAFGHAAGDHLLVEAARRLGTFASDSFFIARLGGDEFGVLIDAEQDIDVLSDLAEDVCQSLRAHYHLNGVVATVSGSFGLAVYPQSGDSTIHLFERADFALYHAKQHVCGGVVIFSDAHQQEITQRSRIDQQIKSANLDLELSVLFQPFVDSNTQKIVGFEALARWDNATLGRVPPTIFIPAAERTGRIGQMTGILLGKALKSALCWPKGTRLSFNLSAMDIVSTRTIDDLLAIVLKSGFDPSDLDFEVTETSVMSNFDIACANIQSLKAHGIGIALDDFGTGHSSLGHVHRLPFRKIKIDRSFIVDIHTNPLSRNIIRTIVDLCRNIGCICVVEGMETREQVDSLRHLGCAIMQGYYFGRPMPLDETLDRMAVQEEMEKQAAVA